MKTEKWLRFFSLVMADSILCILSATMAILIFSANWVMVSKLYYWVVLVVVGVTVLTNLAFRLYTRLWEYMGVVEFAFILGAVVVSNLVLFGLSQLLQTGIYIRIHFVYLILSAASLYAARIVFRFRADRRSVQSKGAIGHKRVMVVGAGKFGSMIIKELMAYPSLGRPVVVVDDDKNKQGHYLRGVKVAGTREDIPFLCADKNIDEIIIAIPSADKKQISEVADICTSTGKKVKILPSLYDTIADKKHLAYENMGEVQLEDLLGREPAKIDYEQLSGQIKGKRVLVTGGGGSIGSELCRIVAGFEPAKLYILDIYENNAYELQQELLRKHPYLKTQIIIASVRDERRIDEVLDRYRPHIVFHAAAHKHVPLCEHNKGEAIRNNVFGTLNVVRAAHRHAVSRFVLISTDKAVNPTNMMGATKRVCELIVKAYSTVSKTVFTAVRFGNVLGSNGSVVKLFKKQIEEGGPVTVTHPDIIRYFMLIPEAAMLVLQAGVQASGGEIFILDMGSPIRIVDLAHKLIRLSGKEPDVDIKIEYTGLRPGEKLFEELLMADEQVSARLRDGIFIGTPEEVDYKDLSAELDRLWTSLETGEEEAVALIHKLVPSYKND